MTGYGAALALRAKGLLAEFNVAGILDAADVHVASRLGVLGGEGDEAVLLAVALTVRSTRQGSVVLDLETAEATTSPDLDVDAGLDAPAPLALSWPEDWAARCSASPLTTASGPLRQVGSRLWLARYWLQEEQVAAELAARCAVTPDDLDPGVLAAALDRLFPAPEDADQRAAAELCARSRVSVLAGGPGTGKTTTVSRLLALLREQHPDWRVALAAPTGKAAARLEEAVRSSSATLGAEDRAAVGELEATTLHRLLGWRPDARSRFRHDRSNRLPADVVVVDEASMVSLTMMARLLEALRPTTRLVLVGDPDQLASVEAGAVLGDLVAGSETGAPGRPGVAHLSTNRRFDRSGPIGRLAHAVRQGDAGEVLALVRQEEDGLEFVDVSDERAVPEAATAAVRVDVATTAALLQEAALRGDGAAALAALDRHRLLCAHRSGPRGLSLWSDWAMRWSMPATALPTRGGHHVGEPLLVTENDYEIGLYNGDSGVVVQGADGPVAVFARGGGAFAVPLTRLGAVRALHAMTVHRSQGSQFERVTLVLPPAGSQLATRETLYTAVTRATRHVRILGSPEALAEAVARPAARATGLRERLAGG